MKSRLTAGIAGATDVVDPAGAADTETYGRENKRRPLPHQNNKGFTLVEVIVVLVIIAILMTFAVPALTGYIDRAKQTQYIADARNRAVAIQSVLTELYTTGNLEFDGRAQQQQETYVIRGAGSTSWNIKMWNVLWSSPNEDYLYEQAAALMGTRFPSFPS
jgi:prepilin-type N-terminal cleavage/methylation domain-containing protein